MKTFVLWQDHYTDKWHKWTPPDGTNTMKVPGGFQAIAELWAASNDLFHKTRVYVHNDTDLDLVHVFDMEIPHKRFDVTPIQWD